MLSKVRKGGPKTYYEFEVNSSPLTVHFYVRLEFARVPLRMYFTMRIGVIKILRGCFLPATLSGTPVVLTS